MRPMTIRGCPASIRDDAWWLSADGRGSGVAVAAPAMRVRPALLGLIGLMIAADVLLWGYRPGLSLALMTLLLAGISQAVLSRGTPARALLPGWAGMVMAAVSIIEQVSPLSVVLLLLASIHFAARLVAGTSFGATIRTALWLPGWAVARLVRDIGAVPGQVTSSGRTRAIGLQVLRDWAMPLGLGAVFLLLFLRANPMLEGWLSGIERWELSAQTLARMVFWVAMALLFWPALRLSEMPARAGGAMPLPALPPAVLGVGSVLRALLVFNLLFGLQSVLDLAYLWGGVRLPEGMTYAEYAHRGAYPLILAALLAGGFALLVQPFLTDHPWLRPLLLIWIAQTLLLTVSSILRLDLYVDAYGLTHLRFASFVWMGVVACGLGLLIWQVVFGESAAWVIRQSAGIAVLALWGCSLVNVDGLIVRVNLGGSHSTITQDQWEALEVDVNYLCRLGEGAAPALFAAAGPAQGLRGCAAEVSVPDNWREWGYRNWRVRRSLAAMSEGAMR